MNFLLGADPALGSRVLGPADCFHRLVIVAHYALHLSAHSALERDAANSTVDPYQYQH
jgi:hypothetical protein